MVVSPAQGGQYHSEIANDLLISGYGVLGGGIMYVNPPTIPMMYWGASTMVDAFEYDRPEDESLLDCIKEQLERELAS